MDAVSGLLGQDRSGGGSTLIRPVSRPAIALVGYTLLGELDRGCRLGAATVLR